MNNFSCGIQEFLATLESLADESVFDPISNSISLSLSFSLGEISCSNGFFCALDLS